MQNTVAYLLKARTAKPQPLLGNGCETRKTGINVENGVFCEARAEAIRRGPAANDRLPKYRPDLSSDEDQQLQ
jgi:hypothetical protein